jgi:hypothetical protein
MNWILLATRAFLAAVLEGSLKQNKLASRRLLLAPIHIPVVGESGSKDVEFLVAPSIKEVPADTWKLKVVLRVRLSQLLRPYGIPATPWPDIWSYDTR